MWYSWETLLLGIIRLKSELPYLVVTLPAVIIFSEALQGPNFIDCCVFRQEPLHRFPWHLEPSAS